MEGVRRVEKSGDGCGGNCGGLDPGQEEEPTVGTSVDLCEVPRHSWLPF